MKKYIVLSTLALLLAVGISSCKKDKKGGWDTELLVPIATADLSLENIIKDTSLISKQSDNSLLLTYRKMLYELNLANQIINLPDTFIGTKFTLDSLILPNQRFEYDISLGSLALEMRNQPDPTLQFYGNLLIGQNGNNIIIPPLSGFNTTLDAFEVEDFFEEAILVSGAIFVDAVNNFPIPIEDLVVEVVNTTDLSLIVRDTIPYIPAYGTYYKYIDLAGAHIKGNMSLNVVNFSTPGSGGNFVKIDTTDFIRLDVFITALRASYAKARFPNQDVVNITEEVTQEIGDRKITYIDCRQGTLRVYVASSVEEQLFLKYTLEGAFDRYGRPIVASTTVPAAPPGGASFVDRTYDLKGVSITLTGKNGTKFNTYTQTVVARIDSSGNLREITTNDSLNVKYELKDIFPNYVKGYAGRDTILFGPDSVDFDFLNIFRSGTIDVKDVNMKVTLENGIGVDGVVKINNLVASHPERGTRALSGSILGAPLYVGKATDFPFKKTSSTFSVNSSNSNIAQLISLLPNKLIYDMEVKTNPNGNDGRYRDFAYLESGLKVNLDVEMPLAVIANNLVLYDTVAFDLSNANTDVEGITDGVINIISRNSYPIEAKITVALVDENYTPVDTLAKNMLISAGQLNDNCRVDEAVRNRTPLYVDQGRMENLKKARYAMIYADFSTASSSKCNGEHLKIYSDYRLNVTFTAKFNYTVKTKL